MHCYICSCSLIWLTQFGNDSLRNVDLSTRATSFFCKYTFALRGYAKSLKPIIYRNHHKSITIICTFVTAHGENYQTKSPVLANALDKDNRCQMPLIIGRFFISILNHFQKAITYVGNNRSISPIYSKVPTGWMLAFFCLSRSCSKAEGFEILLALFSQCKVGNLNVKTVKVF